MNKECKKCKIIYPITKFYKRIKLGGTVPVCINCKRESFKEYYRKIKKPKGVPEHIKSSIRKWRKSNPQKTSAHQFVQRALKKGTLKKEACKVCLSPKVEAHHNDYSKPLEVEWLCRKHHCELNRKYT